MDPHKVTYDNNNLHQIASASVPPRQNLKITWQTKQSQNSQCPNGLFAPVAIFQIAGSGKTLPGPTLSGDDALCHRER